MGGWQRRHPRTPTAAHTSRQAGSGLSLIACITHDNGGLRGKDVDAAIKLGIDAQIAADIHVGPGGAVEIAKSLFAAHPTFHQSAVNFETNAGTHTHA